MQLTNNLTYKPTDFHMSFVGVLRDKSWKKLKNHNSTFLNKLNTTVLSDVDIAPIMQDSTGELFLQLAGKLYPLTIGKWIQNEKVTFVDKARYEDVEYNCMMDVKGIHYLLVLDFDKQRP